MRIALTHPFCWPHVRRGSERNMEGLGRYLRRRGHEVVTFSTHPDGAVVETGPAGTRILARTVDRWWLRTTRLQPTHLFFFAAARSVLRARVDVVHSLFYVDGAAANLARRFNSYRTVLQLNGAPIPEAHYRRFPPERWLLRQAILRADRGVTCSRFTRDLIADRYGVDYSVVPTPVELADFDPGDGPADGRPTLLAVADFDVPRKGLRVLLRAFEALKREEPAARLRLSGRLSAASRARTVDALPEAVRRDVEVLGLGQPGDVPRQYREASLLVLPSMWEPSAGVLMEALASGTPVAATNHGGIPEYLTPEVSCLFDPDTAGEETSNVDGLLQAIREGLRLAARPGIRRRCRAHAERYSWDVVGPRIEALYA
jgi:glycosyltransferase involved in cell wall biosynthesis